MTSGELTKLENLLFFLNSNDIFQNKKIKIDTRCACVVVYS